MLVGVEVDDAFEVTAAFAGVRPVAVAVLFTAPASTSAWVIVYGAVVVQVVDAFGARVVVGQVVAPTFASTMASPVMVCAPVLVTAKENPSRSPASTRPLVFVSVGVPAVLVSARVASVLVDVAVESEFEVTVAPPGRARRGRGRVRHRAGVHVGLGDRVGPRAGRDALRARAWSRRRCAGTSESLTAAPVRVWAPVLVNVNV